MSQKGASAFSQKTKKAIVAEDDFFELGKFECRTVVKNQLIVS